MALNQDAADWIGVAPVRDRAVSLVHVCVDQRVETAHTLAGKRVITEYEDGVTLMLWIGKWWTDVRTVTGPQRLALRDLLA